MRYRSRVDDTCVITASGSGGSTTWSREGKTSMQDQVTSGYGTLLKQRRKDPTIMLPVNPLVVQTNWDDFSLGSMSVRWKNTYGGGMVTHGVGLCGPLTDGHLQSVGGSQPSVDLDALVTQAVAKAKEPVWDAATFVGELMPTVRMFYNLWETFYDTLKRLWDQFLREQKRDRGGNLRTLWEEFARWWLTYRYGLRPFYSDMLSMEKAAKLLAKKHDRLRLKRGQAKGTASRLTSGEQRSSTWSVGSPTTGVAGISSGDSFKTHVVTTVDMQVSCTAVAGVWFRGNNGVIGRDPFVTAYELVTLSFVLDWFVDFGSWIQSWAPTVKGDLAYTSVTSQLEILTTTTARQFVGDEHWGLTGTGGNSVFVSGFRQITRTPLSYTGAVPVQIDLNWKRCTDIIALAIALRFGKGFLDNIRN